MNTCPRCKSNRTRILWDKVVFCNACKHSSLVGEKRYTLSCTEDWEKLVPRANYSKPTLVCLKCGKEYRLPGESTPEVIEEALS